MPRIYVMSIFLNKYSCFALAFLVWILLQLILKLFWGCHNVSKAVTGGRTFKALDEPAAVFKLAV
jgi:hypothetical protein